MERRAKHTSGCLYQLFAGTHRTGMGALLSLKVVYSDQTSVFATSYDVL